MKNNNKYHYFNLDQYDYIYLHGAKYFLEVEKREDNNYNLILKREQNE